MPVYPVSLPLVAVVPSPDNVVDEYVLVAPFTLNIGCLLPLSAPKLVMRIMSVYPLMLENVTVVVEPPLTVVLAIGVYVAPAAIMLSPHTMRKTNTGQR